MYLYALIYQVTMRKTYAKAIADMSKERVLLIVLPGVEDICQRSKETMVISIYFEMVKIFRG